MSKNKCMSDNEIKMSAEMAAGDMVVKAGIRGDQKAVNKFLSGLVPSFMKDGIGILSDQVKFWRWTNQVRIIKNAQAKIESSGLKKNQISLKVLVPLMEYSSLEEDANMQEKWVNMLANAATGNVEVSPNYIGILKELSPIEVLILENLFQGTIHNEEKKEMPPPLQFSKKKIEETFNLSEQKGNLIIENLFRLSLCRMPGSSGMTFGENMRVAVNTREVFEFTTLGYEFVRACSWKK
jgi:hypothetical protein